MVSEFVDSFLKNAAFKTNSYVKDTTDFINKIRNINLPTEGEVRICTLDVKSLYTNIDHGEGLSACFHFMSQRKNERFLSIRICHLIQLILQSNTMKFMNKFYHQIKGTAMGTPMAVNYANLFMAKFEEDMLDDYQQIHGTQPLTWLRYIDDVFFIWHGDEESLQHFIEFVKSYSLRNNMKSTIEFKDLYSSSSVSFLDTVVSVEGNRLTTNLFCKPTAAHDYLQRSSYHPQHLLKAIPKGQFMRIRRICTHLRDYRQHAAKFVDHFRKRGYNEAELQRTASEVEAMSRDDLLKYKRKTTTSDRVPLVITYHHKLTNIPAIIHKNYDKMVRKYPEMKEVFPSPPVVSFRRPRNLGDSMVRSDHTAKKTTTPPKTTTRKRRTTIIDHLMNNSGTITNTKAGITLPIEGGLPTDAGVIYAVRCTKHDIISVGNTTHQLNERMNGHRSQITTAPQSCELVSHFATCGCDFRKDVEISILEHVSGSPERMVLHEDKWITRLNTKAPYGLNVRLTCFGRLYFSLFE